jgi:hypothetical protein
MLACTVGTDIAYCRYNVDGYGEQSDRTNWTGAGVGRVWPLLAGGRGQYASWRTMAVPSGHRGR